MPIKLNLVQPPIGMKSRTSSYRENPKGAFPEVPIFQFPFVNGEIRQIHGWLEGLGADAINGRIELVLHEGLFTVNGDLKVYFPHTHQNVNIIMAMIERTATGLAYRFPKSRFRIKVTYETKWVGGDAEDQFPN
jgi:hypothetical protein